jgi:hypothetical protein
MIFLNGLDKRSATELFYMVEFQVAVIFFRGFINGQDGGFCAAT